MDPAAATDDAVDDDKTRRRESSRALRQDQEDTTRDILGWIRSLSGSGAFKLRIDRKKPEVGPNGENLAGLLEWVEGEQIDETYVQDKWGGGTFQLQLHLPNGNGNFQYKKAVTTKIAGEPKINGRLLVAGGSVHAPPPAPIEDGGLADRAIGLSERVAERERERADRLEAEARRGGGADMAMMTALLEPMRAQLEASNRRGDSLQEQLLTLMGKPVPTDSFRDRVLEQAVTGESSRITELTKMYEHRLDKMRDDHATEIRQIGVANKAERDRLEDRHDRAVADLTKTHERAIAELTKSHERELRLVEKGQDAQTKSLEVANGARFDAIERENKRMIGEMAALKAENAELRARKEKSPSEQVKELASLKESMDVLTGGGGDDGEKPWYERLAGALGNSEVAMRLAERIGGGDDDGDEPDDAQPARRNQAAAPEVQHPPVNTLIRNPDDNQFYIYRGEGKYQGPIPPAKVKAIIQGRRRQAAAAAAAARQPDAAPAAAAAAGAPQSDDDVIAAALAETENADHAAGLPAAPAAALPAPASRTAPAAQRPKGKPPTPEQVKMAVEFLEAALSRGNAKPDEIARTAKLLLPANLRGYIQQVGVDRFLAEVAVSRPGSPLATQLGKNFVNQVARFLFGTPA